MHKPNSTGRATFPACDLPSAVRVGGHASQLRGGFAPAVSVFSIIHLRWGRDTCHVRAVVGWRVKRTRSWHYRVGTIV